MKAQVSNENESVLLSVILSSEQKLRLRLLAAKLDLTMSKAGALAVEEFCARTESDPAFSEVSHHAKK